MSTTSPTSGLLNILTSVNGVVSLGVTIGDVVVPLVVGVIKSIKSDLSGGTTVTYTVEIQTEQAVLDAIIASGATDIGAINAELTRMGIPNLVIQAGTPTPAPIAAAPASK